MPLQPRPDVAALQPAVHGAEPVPGSSGVLLDFSACCNPYGPPSGLRNAVRRAAFDKYPDSRSGALRQALAERNRLPCECVLVAGGSTDLIRLAALAYLRQRDSVAVLQPTFGEYAIAGSVMGGTVQTIMLEESAAFRADAGNIAMRVRQISPRILFLCNPNNPAGWYLDEASVSFIINSCPETLVVIDEAYVDFVGDMKWESNRLLERGNVLILRSMTKSFAIAGLRLGYAVGTSSLIDHLERVQLPWSVNSQAQSAGLWAASHGDSFLRDSTLRIRREKERLARAIRRLGYYVIEGDAHYLLVKVGKAAVVRAELLDLGISIRDCTSFGLSSYVRVSPHRQSENDNLIAAFRELSRT